MPREPQTKPCTVPEPIQETVGPKEGRWIGIAPFAKHRGKIYPIPLTDELIGLLNETYDRVFIFGGGEHEKSFAEGMERRHKGVVSVIGRMSMSQEMDLIGNLDAIVTMDSATMHIASLLGIPWYRYGVLRIPSQDSTATANIRTMRYRPTCPAARVRYSETGPAYPAITDAYPRYVLRK